jgi:ABC-type lipoprotein release transport system permease subunit
LHLQAQALLLFAALGLIAVVTIVGQGLSRHIFEAADDFPALAALGMTPAQLGALGLLRAVVTAAVAALVSIVVAVLLSPVFPIGFARAAEVSPGLHVDAFALSLGAAALLGAIVARGLVPAIRAATAWRRVRVERGSRLAMRLARLGAPPSVVTGVRMALEPGRGSSAVPVRAALVGGVIAVASFTAAYTLGASQSALARTPSMYGWTWDVSAGNPNGEDVRDSFVPMLSRRGDVEAYSGVGSGAVRIEGRQANATGVDTVRGDVEPPAIHGRAPAAADEVGLSPELARTLGRTVGDAVTIEGPKATLKMRVSGIVVSEVGGGVFPKGVVIPLASFERVAGKVSENVFLIRFKPGIDRDAAYASIRAAVGPTVLRPLRSTDLENLGRVAWVPYALAALLLALGLATVAHMLATSVRRRRVELAVLKSLGFRRRQIAATVASQASTTTLIALAVGIPLGVAGGRWAWRVIVDQIGVVPSPVTPVAPVLIGTLATLVLANAIASVPARIAARIPAGVALRVE